MNNDDQNAAEVSAFTSWFDGSKYPYLAVGTEGKECAKAAWLESRRQSADPTAELSRGSSERLAGKIRELGEGYAGWRDNVTLQYCERLAPLTLDEIVAAVRTNELVTIRDMRYAIVAFDVLMSQLHVDRNVEQLAEFFKAASTPPREYAGEANDPGNPEAVEWYRAMHAVKPS